MAALSVNLRPVFDSEGAAQVIDITMFFTTYAKTKGDILFNYTLKRANVPTTQFTAQSVRLTDSHKSVIRLYTVDTERSTHREFRVEEDISTGERLTVQYQATPRQVNAYTSCGPPVAMEKDNGGLSGAGLALLLIPSAGDGNSDVVHDILQELRAHLGKGSGLLCMKDYLFFPSVFLLVARYPAAAVDSPFRIYWLSEPPFNAYTLGKQLQKLVPRMAMFFGDDEKLFQVFIRRNEYKCASGLVCTRDEDIVQDFLMHEIVHNWPRLGFTTGGPEDLIDGWFNEGIAEYYSLILPYIFSILTEDQFIQRFNWRISGYYTNPDRAVHNKDVQDRFWLPGRVHRIPYQRGFMYFVQLAYKLHNLGKRPLDDLIRKMIKLRAANQPHGIHVWLSLIEIELGSMALEDYKDMSNGKQMILSPDVAGVWISNSKWKLEPVAQEEFYLGFPEENLSSESRVINGLDLQSRAAEAGLQDGDEITLEYGFLVDADVSPKLFTMNVRRSNQETLRKITWWPRSWHTVQSYQFA
ncbi:conserved hypothetical protein [Talaromyces stipitatus ATCC 10500]|uniref:Peptidase M61 catalytic domain-containing protein n=1 Tax=Talaromyces stipitatus (strain ATCC 10500 / CBS 375.48 / QM 6759 / NRRL 1006) TaxID=441959 RepID=B8MJQ4_TALSN|nr:uncharacterized protein TSTA_051900 [Talaromyces stipitatus ATCC 10500]EED15753.1 conserved hypothetical protein [Talaromyces stipitatus ATCC 10500]